MKKFIFLFIIVLMSGCATSGDFELVRQDLANARRESFELKKELESLREKTASALGEIDKIREITAVAVKEDSFAAVRENQAEINLRLSDISSSLQDLRGRFEENKYNLEKSFRDSATERDMLRAQMAAMENELRVMREKLAIPEEPRGKEHSKKPAEELRSEQDKHPADEQETKPPSPVQEEQAEKKAYDSAYQTYKNKKYKEAREKFEAFLKDYPGSKLTDNAQFWIAESHYAEKDYENAILAYETLLKKYPDSKKTASALLKQGYAFFEIGDLKTGRAILKKLTEKYPDSDEAALARKRLAEADKKSRKKK